jgi:hypothetical protein
MLNGVETNGVENPTESSSAPAWKDVRTNGKVNTQVLQFSPNDGPLPAGYGDGRS